MADNPRVRGRVRWLNWWKKESRSGQVVFDADENIWGVEKGVVGGVRYQGAKSRGGGPEGGNEPSEHECYFGMEVTPNTGSRFSHFIQVEMLKYKGSCSARGSFSDIYTGGTGHQICGLARLPYHLPLSEQNLTAMSEH